MSIEFDIEAAYDVTPVRTEITKSISRIAAAVPGISCKNGPSRMMRAPNAAASSCCSAAPFCKLISEPLWRRVGSASPSSRSSAASASPRSDQASISPVATTSCTFRTSCQRDNHWENHDAVFVQNQIDRMIQRVRDISIAELLVERASRICGPPFHPHVFSRESGGQVAPHMIRGEVFREQAEPGLCDFAIGARIRVQQADQVSNLLRSCSGNELAHAGRDG